MARALGEQAVTEPVDEHDAHAFSRGQAERGAPLLDARERCAERAEGRGQHAVEAPAAVVRQDEAGALGAGRGQSRLPALARESARAKSSAARTASAPSACAETRTTTSSGELVPV